MPSKTVAASTEDVLYEHGTELQLVAALQNMSPFPIPFVPHINELSELAYILMCEKRRGRREAPGTGSSFPHISNGELNSR